ncbi:GIY-YIG nuclease family protein [Streptomyces scabiei]|uniref:GIY-YIG nuclease family protein n=1 Tax=Streptomyces scabiei TaxID=1930 RepID=UPI0029ABF3F6|nr:GIY-YIG nuclease family protein [Streptomyces scabiei]MDX2538598.1 GIY-YIG nuclease family protein [Streptomyces scabiei]MDX2799872.1 GIY-YIG nuclease family protein [Streptomyces scabiei]MDX2861787.1 GIY-YIG nuclease family protein [Streptomyces scabiei]MDX3283382.1 GIY-YIG nuclease family protein [Streptomyces scabiei]MDX3828527.1 GIY-YIG nuclease family protein [Streptomyces scabiei]
MYEGNRLHIWSDDGIARLKDGDPAAELSQLLDENDPAYSRIMQTLMTFSLSGIELSPQAVEMAIKVGQHHHRTDQELGASTYGIKPDQDGGVVYYVRRGSMVKIGTTVNMYKRMAAILPDEVLATEPGSYSLEAQRHRQFRKLRVTGQVEWFHAGPLLQEHILTVRSLNGEPDPTLPVLRSS